MKMTQDDKAIYVMMFGRIPFFVALFSIMLFPSKADAEPSRKFVIIVGNAYESVYNGQLTEAIDNLERAYDIAQNDESTDEEDKSIIATALATLLSIRGVTYLTNAYVEFAVKDFSSIIELDISQTISNKGMPKTLNTLFIYIEELHMFISLSLVRLSLILNLQ